MRLLLVEDDPVFAPVLARALRRRGCQVQVAASTQAALTLARDYPPEAAVLDLMLGNESGLALIEPLLGVAPGMRILVLTGYARITTAVAATKKGAFDYLAKPADADQVMAALTGGGPPDSPVPPARPLSPRRLEWEHIQRVLDAHEGNVSATARALGLHRRSLQRKLAKRPVRG